MKSLFHILFACIESHFVDIPFLQKWTETLINKSKCPQYWLVELTMCSDSESVLNVLSKYLAFSDNALCEDYWEIILGFLYLSYINNKLTLDQFIYEVVDVADAYEIEAYLYLGELLDKNQVTTENLQELLLKKFVKYKNKANLLYKYLTSDNLYEKEQELIEYS